MGGKKKISRREFLGTIGVMLSSFLFAGRSVFSAMEPNQPIKSGGEGCEFKSDVYLVNNCPRPGGSNYHEGLDALLDLMGYRGLNLYKTEKEVVNGSQDGWIDKNDVVLIKVNAQWKYRGCTNSDVIRGLIQRILEHPDGFEGEIVIFENGQGEGDLGCNPTAFGRYTDTDVHANAEDESHSYLYLINEVFNDERVSGYLLDPVRAVFISADDHTTDGYRKLTNVSYPCFTTAKGNRVELKEGIWDGSGYTDNLKLINVPVLKHHAGCGITACLKHTLGILTMSYKPVDYHYSALGLACGEMFTLVRTPVINILDCIWVSPVTHWGHAEQAVRLDKLMASVDSVALDYWGSKHLLYPVDENEENHPDKFRGLGDSLIQARDTINANGGINGQKVTMGDENTNVITYESIVEEVRKKYEEGEICSSFAENVLKRYENGM